MIVHVCSHYGDIEVKPGSTEDEAVIEYTKLTPVERRVLREFLTHSKIEFNLVDTGRIVVPMSMWKVGDELARRSHGGERLVSAIRLVDGTVKVKRGGIMGFLVAPYVFTTYERAADYLGKSPELCSYYLVQLEPGADLAAVCDRIGNRVPELDAFPRNVYSRISINFWMTRTGLGISFGAATLLGLLVGMVMVAQTLYALVLDRLGEFGTLKAIGATERQVYSILLVQALVMAMVGSLIGIALVGGIQHFYSTPRAPIVIPYWLSLGSCVLVLAICLISSLLPYQRIRKVDPLMVLQS